MNRYVEELCVLVYDFVHIVATGNYESEVHLSTNNLIRSDDGYKKLRSRST